MNDDSGQATGVIISLAEFDKDADTWPVFRFACDGITAGTATGHGAFFKPIQTPDAYRHIATILLLLANEYE